MPIYWSDYLAATMALSTIEHGAYLLLIAHLWSTKKPIADDDNALSRITRLPPQEWVTVRPNIIEFFECKRGQISHKRVTTELERAANVHEKRVNAGRKRYSKNNDLPAHAPAQLQLNHTQPQPQPQLDKKVSKREGPPKRRLSLDWEPSQDDYNYAKEKGFTGDRFNNEVAAFIRYFTGPDAKNPARADWGRSWKAWIDRSHQRGGASRGRQSPTSVTAAAFELISEMEERERNGSARDGGSGGVENWAGLGDPVVQANGTGSDSEAFVGVTIENGEQRN